MAPTKPRTDALPPRQSLPLNGTVTRNHSGAAVAPFKMVTRDSERNFFVKVCTWPGGKNAATIATIFVRAGSTAETTLPLGSYQIKYATGVDWYGPRHHFGPDAQINEAKSRFDFEEVGGEVRGYSIELFLRPSGNLKTGTIRPEDF